MTDMNKYDGSTNPFDDQDEIVPESAQNCTSLQLPPQHVQHKSAESTTEKGSIKSNRDSKNIQRTTMTNTSNQNEKDSSKFLQKTKEGINNALLFTSEKIGKPITSFSQKVNDKFTRLFNL